MTAKRRLGTTGYYVVSILIAVVAMIPFLWMISTSLKSRGALMSIPIEWIPAEPSLDAYGEVRLETASLFPCPTLSSP